MSLAAIARISSMRSNWQDRNFQGDLIEFRCSFAKSVLDWGYARECVSNLRIVAHSKRLKPDLSKHYRCGPELWFGVVSGFDPSGELDSTTHLDMDDVCCRMWRDRFVRLALTSLVRADAGSGVESVLVA
jgi:hypothetical protein